ncbi:MAG: zinc metalloprotease HtpX [Candidatus Niyogibacteria bacterium RIFCSPLOWO2_01_FULL_45_48]|uniref:Protease HtpX homolog n=2 Tax=Parcubacteria group TaxID=1794811 RepID=A0A1G2R596_9BACT|nr:MAG: zinc metalloprotease HtpX [Candidatus Niyogibacteria bacterium RIFCSPHIGHO2_01_FULL_45_28]OGZ29971.1 MAG: zinc metalloprotease HtpX [Candidatus Niyogibacteria bacterium RIFCSPLOWO2_01_FULL_45_48]OHA68024.1 MAG: zinc metalloprotease HtpX [Candidatus Wildermuthbacteria bacterium RIFCSPHIGHO2_02_FULL_47_17]
MNLYKHRESNIRKTWFLFAGFLIFVVGVGWIFSQVYGNPSILIFAVVFSLVMNFFSYWYSDKIVLKMSGAHPVEKKQAPELYNVVENLAITAGLPTPKIYLVNDQAPNAFATGRDPKHAVVAVTTGLLNVLDRSELEGVIAHELGHIGNRDILLSTAVVVLVGFVALLSDMFMRSMFWGRGFGGDRDNRSSGAIMIIGVILAIVAPISAVLIQLAISRKREFLADTSGSMLTRYPEGLALALEKIGKYSAPMRSASNATAHLWISDPHGKKQNMMSKLFMTHPPAEERIARLRGLKV